MPTLALEVLYSKYLTGTVTSFKMSFNGPISESFPSPDDPKSATVSFVQNGWTISTRKLPISKSDAIDAMAEKLGIPVPEMIFGDNLVSVENVEKGWRLEFNSFDALDRVDKTDRTMLKVAYSKAWSESRWAMPSCVAWIELNK